MPIAGMILERLDREMHNGLSWRVGRLRETVRMLLERGPFR